MNAPNILWVVTTQWRGQARGAAGDPNARTPCLDALAARGCDYRQATTPHPFGPFARAAMLTGVLSPANGVTDYYDPLPRTARTVAHDLAQRGYVTAFFGKWHLAPRDRTAALVGEVHARTVVAPADRGGFQCWEGFEGGFLLNDPWMHGTRLPEPVRLRGYQSDVVTEWTADWVREMSPRGLSGGAAPWFAVASLEAPHPPYAAPVPPGIQIPDATGLVLADNVPPDAAVHARARRELAGYYAHIEATDRAIGRLVDGLDRNVVVVVTSVHGDLHGAHGRWRKGWPYEEAVRVPLVVAGAGVAAGPNDDPVSLLDLPAMTRAWADGRTWRCDRDRAPISMPAVVGLPDQCDRTWSGWRSATRKQVLGPDGAPWLDFDLAVDPGETVNRA